MKYLDLLGYRVTDRITGFSGVVESISYDLYGCIQPLVTPDVDEKGKLETGRFFDGARLQKSGNAPVIPPPSFSGAAHCLDLLGYPATDCITGFQGVVEAVNFDLTGRVDVTLRPPVDKEKKTMENSHWFHVSRVTVTKVSENLAARVMAPPLAFAEHEQEPGPAEKPAR